VGGGGGLGGGGLGGGGGIQFEVRKGGLPDPEVRRALKNWWGSGVRDSAFHSKTNQNRKHWVGEELSN